MLTQEAMQTTIGVLNAVTAHVCSDPAKKHINKYLNSFVDACEIVSRENGLIVDRAMSLKEVAVEDAKMMIQILMEDVLGDERLPEVQKTLVGSMPMPVLHELMLKTAGCASCLILSYAN